MLVVICALLLIPAPSLATPVVGSFDIGGSSITFSALSLVFGCNLGLSNAACPAPADYGNFLASSKQLQFA
jgi:hypothetical protein